MDNEPGSESSLHVIERALRVADQQATAYAVLRDRYRIWSRVLDISILLLSIWLVAMTFVEPGIGDKLSPGFVKREIWIGLLSIGAFCLSSVQLLVDWKGRAESYSRSLAAVSGFVKGYRGLVRGGSPTPEVIKEAMAVYAAVSDSVEPVPESQFLKLKQRHKIKMLVSQRLDELPARSIWLIRLSLFVEHNFCTKVRDGVGKDQQ